MRLDANTVGGKIFIGVATVLISGAIGAVGGALFTRNSPPQAAVVPATITVRADDIIQFSAEASRDPDGDQLTYAWSVGGIPLSETPWARCSVEGPRARCKFVAPGTFGIAVQVADARGLTDTAVASATVVIEGGYIGLRVMGRDERAQAVYRALLVAVDWAAVQAHAPRLMIFDDPDGGGPLYAAALRPDPTADFSALRGVRVMLPFSRGPAFDMIESSLLAVGADVLPMAVDEVIIALSRGMSDVGFVPLSEPEGVMGDPDF